MKLKAIKPLRLLLITSLLLSACATYGPADSRWSNYKSWTKITQGRVNTGDPTGFVGGVHKGPKGYRDIFVNNIALFTNQGTAPYNYPVGSVLVKEQYKDKAAWQAQKSAELTVMVKVGSSTKPSINNWAFAVGYGGKAESNAFCAGCHSIAAIDDFVFTNQDFFKSH